MSGRLTVGELREELSAVDDGTEVVVLQPDDTVAGALEVVDVVSLGAVVRIEVRFPGGHSLDECCCGGCW